MKSKISVSAEEFKNARLNSQSLAQATCLFETHGALWIENVFDREFIENLGRAYNEKYTSLNSKQLHRQHALVGDKRFMVTVVVKRPFNSPTLYANPLILPIVENLLGCQCTISSFGSVVTFPGAKDQPIHTDHPPLFSSEETCAELPPHAITVVIPLVDVSVKTGSTGIWDGSHKRVGARKTLVELMENPSWEGATYPLPKMGDVYLMDYRVIHGGMANRGSLARPILYIVYGRPWFRDNFNFLDQPPVLISKKQYKKVPKRHRHLFSSAVLG